MLLLCRSATFVDFIPIRPTPLSPFIITIIIIIIIIAIILIFILILILILIY